MKAKFYSPLFTGIMIVVGARLALAASAGASSDAMPPSVRGVVVTSPGVNTADAKAYALQHDRLLLSDYLEKTRPGDEHDRMLKQKLERAQRAWLGGEIELARSEFRALTELSLKADWREAQRAVLQTAYFRLAQSAESGTERSGWLESAARLFGDRAPEASLFPPPLLNEYREILKRLEATAIDVDLAGVFSDFRYVLIDGRKIEIALEPHVRLTMGLHRLTALSDSNEAVTEFMTAAQLRVLRLAPPSLTEGACGEASLRSRSELSSSIGFEIYSGRACPEKLSNLLKTSRLLSEPQGTAPPAAPSSSGETRQRTWLWVVGAAVVAGTAYALAHQSQSSPQATHKTGF
jgi:hypothetical protein